MTHDHFVHDFQFETVPQDAPPLPQYLAFDADRNLPLSSTQEFLLEYETNIDRLLANLRQSDNIYEQIDLLETLSQLCGTGFDTGFSPNHPVTLPNLLDEVYNKAGQLRLWSVIRRAAGLRNKVYIGLSDAVTSILIRGKQIAVGKAYSEASLIDRPLSPEDVIEKIQEFCGNDIRECP